MSVEDNRAENLERFLKAMDFRDNYEEKVQETANYLRGKIPQNLLERKIPEFGLVLGSGLGGIAESIVEENTILYEHIPNFPRTTTPGHEGKFIVGQLEKVPIIGLQGRVHYHEVADEPFQNGLLKVMFPIHVLANLGVKNYFVTNAAGGLNPEYKVGDMMIISSHINCMPNPLLGRKHSFRRVDTGDEITKFLPMHHAYDPGLSAMLKEAGSDNQEYMKEGVYLAVSGPAYETEAESQVFRESFRADAVGMSTTPEVIAARNRGMKVVGMSYITNVIDVEGVNATSHSDVLAASKNGDVQERIASTVKEFFRSYRKANFP